MITISKSVGGAGQNKPVEVMIVQHRRNLNYYVADYQTHITGALDDAMTQARKPVASRTVIPQNSNKLVESPFPPRKQTWKETFWTGSENRISTPKTKVRKQRADGPIGDFPAQMPLFKSAQYFATSFNWQVENYAFDHATCQIIDLNPLKPAKGTDVHHHLNHR
jgi:hypothetical protein